MYYDFSWLLTTVVMSVIDFTIPTNLLAELPFDLTVTTWTATNVAWKLLKNLLRANLIVCFLWTGAQDMNLLCLIRNRWLLNILFKSIWMNWCILTIPSKMRIVYSFWVKQKVFKQGRVWCGCWVVQHSVEQTSSHQTGKQIPYPHCVHLHRGENGVHDDSAAGANNAVFSL